VIAVDIGASGAESDDDDASLPFVAPASLVDPASVPFCAGPLESAAAPPSFDDGVVSIDAVGPELAAHAANSAGTAAARKMRRIARHLGRNACLSQY
jgi:hypothetical protein